MSEKDKNTIIIAAIALLIFGICFLGIKPAFTNLQEARAKNAELSATKDGVTVSNYGYTSDTGFISLQCSANAIAPATTGISQFVRDLEGLGLFESVEYTGFSGSGEGGYSFSVTAVCKPDANAPVVEAPEVPAEETEVPAEEG